MSANLIHSYLAPVANFTMNHIIRPLGSLDKRVIGAFAIVFGLACAGVSYLYSIKKKNLPVAMEDQSKNRIVLDPKAQTALNSLNKQLPGVRVTLTKMKNEWQETSSEEVKSLTCSAWQIDNNYSAFHELIKALAQAGCPNHIMTVLDTIINTETNTEMRGHVTDIIFSFPEDKDFDSTNLYALAFLVATKKKDDNFKSMLLNRIDYLIDLQNVTDRERFAKQFNACATEEERKAFIQSVNKYTLSNLISALNNPENMPKI